MDVEETIRFILDAQANAEVRMAKAEARMDRAEARVDKFDRRLDAIAKLVQQGMKLVVENQRIKELQAAQKVTERKLQALIDSLKQPKNGRNGHQIETVPPLHA